METYRREDLIESAAKRQFKADFPSREWVVDGPSPELDKRALYLFQAEQYLMSHGVIEPAAKQAA